MYQLGLHTLIGQPHDKLEDT